MRSQNMLLSTTVALSAFFWLAGCATQGATEATLATDEMMTHDGLYPVSNSRADAAWARPGADISQYSKIMLEGVGVEYRPGGESGRLYNRRTSTEYFEISEAQKERFETMMSERFREELSKSEHFTLVDEAGPDVLLIRGGLLDVVSYVPPETAGRSEIFLSRFGEATLVLEIRDSVSEAILARAVDRRAAESAAQDFRRANRATTAAEVRRVAGIWARILREQLDHHATL